MTDLLADTLDRGDTDADDLVESDGTGQPLPTASDGTIQWRAETFQLVNWGGFEGRVVFNFHPGATLVSGPSGSGKSTLLDAYLALMMPSDTPFNGASNDAVGGRARSADQRNLLSYLRGKTDTVLDADGRSVDHVLRGRGTPTWGAIGMTFVNDHGHRFTALRAYHVPARATRTGDIHMRMATVDTAPGEPGIDLVRLEQTVASALAPKAMRETFPGLRNHDSYGSFANTVHTRLGIGGNGDDGSKALRLLVRIQSGQQIRTVDELFKEMVLERPATYAAADTALTDFDELEASYQAMDTEQKKADLLAPITAWHTDLIAAQAELAALDVVGLTTDGATPFLLWQRRTEERLLDAAADTNRGDRTQVSGTVKATRDAERDTSRQLAAVRAEHRDAGGGELEGLEPGIKDAEALIEDRKLKRHQLVGATATLAAPLGTATDFEALTAAAAAFERTREQRSAELTQLRDGLRADQFPLLGQRRDLNKELESLAGRDGRVPSHLDDMRAAVAAASGIPSADLPFLAEVVDLAPGQEQWRTAIETVLGAAARQMLVPAHRLEEFSAAIDPLRLRGRLTFVGAEVTAPHAGDPVGDRDRVAGKLVYAESPFTDWVQRFLSNPGRNALCVPDASGLAGDGLRVTAAGQTRRGTSGSHGRNDRSNIIGFSNASAIAELEAELADVEAQLTGLDTRVKAVEGEMGDLERTAAAYRALGHYTFTDIDVDGATARLEALVATRRRLLEADEVLSALAARIAELEVELEARQRDRFRAEAAMESLEAEQERIVDRQDEVADELAALTDRVDLTGDQEQRLDAAFAAAGGSDHVPWASVEQVVGRMRAALRESLARSEGTVKSTSASLVRTFEQFCERWPNPNLGTRVESYPDYAEILENIVTTGLHARRAAWKEKLVEWSGQDLVPLYRAMRSSVAEIQERLDPINDILAGLDFGATSDRLRIRMRTLSPEAVVTFTRELKRLSGDATRDLHDADLDRRFARLQTFMAKIRARNDPRYSPESSDRDRLLDVRRHVEITAERYDTTGRTLSTHSALGGKSGGESQELVAFIVGAALRFRLGDEDRSRPRFAPVFLDEGFVKSDAEFTGRAVQAWKGLGFQLIVGAPLDKVTALEPHMDDMLAITKNNQTGYSFVHPLRDTTAQSAAGTGEG